jgi:endoglucanase
MNPAELSALMSLLKQPTAPFREMHVAAWARGRLDAAGVPWYEDPAGNLLVGVKDRAAYRALIRARDSEPVRVFIAHMDHPGFHGVRWIGPDRLHVKWFGGAPVRHLAGARVWLADAQGTALHGRFKAVALDPGGRMILHGEVQVDLHDVKRPQATSLFGGFGFRAPVWRSGRRLYTKAADDLVGVYAIVATAQRLFARKRRPVPFLGLLTRAEEVGFVGAIAHLELGWLDEARRPLMAVSLEASRTLPGALVGKGPIVRLGDRRTVFDAGGTQLLSTLAEGLLPGAHQRRIMDGGACEATAAISYGLPAIGMSVPLGNYHNQGFEGGPDCRRAQGPAPEFVHLDDIDGMLTLCRGLMRARLPWPQPFKAQRARLRSLLKTYQSLLVV